MPGIRSQRNNQTWKNNETPTKNPYKQEATKQWNFFWCQTSNPIQPHLLPVLLLLPLSPADPLLELQQLLELPSAAPAPHGVGQWGGPRTPGLGWLLEEMDVFCVLCFSFWKKRLNPWSFYSVSSNLRDRDWNSASEIDGFDVKVRSVSTLWMMREQTTSQILAESFHVNRLAISIAKWLLCRYSWKSERGGGEIKSWK